MQKENERYKPLILSKKDLLPEKEAKVKSKELALLQEKIIAMVFRISGNQNIRVHDVYMIKENAENNGISIYLDIPLFYKEEPIICLQYNKPSIKLSSLLDINTVYVLEMSLYSDLDTRIEFEQLFKTYPDKSFYFETSYFFAKDGRFVKVIDLPKEISTTRQPIYPYELTYQSIMTREDFLYAQRALDLMHNRIEDYLQYKNSENI